MNRLLLFSALFFSWKSLSAQSTAAKASDDARQSAIEFYSKFIGAGSQLFSGIEYALYRPWKEEHPYLYQDWSEGSVSYDHLLYSGVPLLYDVLHDELITEYFDGQFIQLVRMRIDYFVVKGRKFVLLNNHSAPLGFYELLYDGRIKAYARFKKKLLEKTSGVEISREIEEKVEYLIFSDGKYSAVKGKKAILRVLPKHAVELKKFMRENKLNFHKSFPQALVQVAAYNDQLP